MGIAAFGAVVVLTMLASLSFDPRLTWDTREHSTRDEQQTERSSETNPRPSPQRRLRRAAGRRRRNWLPSLIWLIPIVAALVGVRWWRAS